jgi:hypothetical protein
MKTVLLTLLLAGAASLAAELKAPTNAPAPEPFLLCPQPVNIPEAGTVTNFVLYTGRHAFFFGPPAGWRMELDTNTLAFTWTSSDRVTVLSMKINLEGRKAERQPQASLQLNDLRQRFPQARLLAQGPCYTSGERGQSCDLEYVIADQYSHSARVAVVPFEGGWLDFALTTPTERFASQHLPWGGMMNSVHVERHLLSRPAEAAPKDDAPPSSPTTTAAPPAPPNKARGS